MSKGLGFVLLLCCVLQSISCCPGHRGQKHWGSPDGHFEENGPHFGPGGPGGDSSPPFRPFNVLECRVNAAQTSDDKADCVMKAIAAMENMVRMHARMRMDHGPPRPDRFSAHTVTHPKLEENDHGREHDIHDRDDHEHDDHEHDHHRKGHHEHDDDEHHGHHDHDHDEHHRKEREHDDDADFRFGVLPADFPLQQSSIDQKCGPLQGEDRVNCIIEYVAAKERELAEFIGEMMHRWEEKRSKHRGWGHEDGPDRPEFLDRFFFTKNDAPTVYPIEDVRRCRAVASDFKLDCVIDSVASVDRDLMGLHLMLMREKISMGWRRLHRISFRSKVVGFLAAVSLMLLIYGSVTCFRVMSRRACRRGRSPQPVPVPQQQHPVVFSSAYTYQPQATPEQSPTNPSGSTGPAPGPLSGSIRLPALYPSLQPSGQQGYAVGRPAVLVLPHGTYPPVPSHPTPATLSTAGGATVPVHVAASAFPSNSVSLYPGEVAIAPSAPEART